MNKVQTISGAPGASYGVCLAAKVVARLRRVGLRAVCRRTRTLRRSLRQLTREIYICP